MKKARKKFEKYFELNKKYTFEWNDLRAFITVINVILIMTFGLSIAWFGLAIALIGMVKDVFVDRRLNGLIMHVANAVLNVYFLILCYA